jgi:hypothetical protein
MQLIGTNEQFNGTLQRMLTVCSVHTATVVFFRTGIGQSILCDGIGKRLRRFAHHFAATTKSHDYQPAPQKFQNIGHHQPKTSAHEGGRWMSQRLPPCRPSFANLDGGATTTKAERPISGTLTMFRTWYRSIANWWEIRGRRMTF